VGQGIHLGLPEGSLRRTLQQVDQAGLPYVSKAMCCIDKVVTRVEISVVFDDGNIPAARTKDAQRMLLPKGRPGSLLKDLYFDPADILAHPLVKDGTEKSAKRFRRHSAAADAASGVGLWLDQGQKSYVLGSELLEEPVHLERITDIVRMHRAEYLGWNLMLLQEPVSTDRLFMGRLLVLGDTMNVV
jgi:hypothetical protein